jgi:SWI/SNF-related matrix-associated actin-dependent regulator of chromatin subfamily D
VKLFQKDTIYFPYVPDLLIAHLKPLEPVKLVYTIRVDETYINGTPATDSEPAIAPSTPTIYDIRVPLPNPVVAELTKFQNNRSHINELQTIIRTDEDLALLVQKVHNTNAKRKFYENLAKDPAAFVKRWFSSQIRDQDVILAEGLRGGGEEGSGELHGKGGKEGLWGTQQAQESVGLFLARNTKAH